MADPVDTQNIVGNILRLGTIESVDHADATCRVRVGEIVTPALPWIAQRAGGTRSWSPPTVDEQCLLFSPEGDTLAGLVLLGMYSNACPAPSDDADVDLVLFPDGALVSYDSAAHQLRAILPAGGKVEIEASGGLRLRGPLTVDGPITATGDVVGGGVSLKGHRHIGVQPGTAQSGPPAP